MKRRVLALIVAFLMMAQPIAGFADDSVKLDGAVVVDEGLVEDGTLDLDGVALDDAGSLLGDGADDLSLDLALVSSDVEPAPLDFEQTAIADGVMFILTAAPDAFPANAALSVSAVEDEATLQAVAQSVEANGVHHVFSICVADETGAPLTPGAELPLMRVEGLSGELRVFAYDQEAQRADEIEMENGAFPFAKSGLYDIVEETPADGEEPAQPSEEAPVDGGEPAQPAEEIPAGGFSIETEGSDGIELLPEEIQNELDGVGPDPEIPDGNPAEAALPFDQSRTVNGVVVTVKADAGVFPTNAQLSVKRVPTYKKREAAAAIDEVRDEDQNVAVSYTFDIKVIDPDTKEELQPAEGQTVSVSFALSEVADENLETNVYHITEEKGGLVAENLDVTTEDQQTAVVETDGFSLYTVEFTYGDLEYVLPGDASVAMSEILDALDLTGEVTAAEVSNPSLFSASDATGAWVVSALRPFTSTEWMKVTINDIVYKITVTDSLIQSVSYIDESGAQQTRNAAVLTASDTVWKANTETDGWYVVNDIIDVENRITVQGDVKLILANVTTLTAKEGITVSAGNALSIYAQSEVTGAGALLTVSDSGAAIGEINGAGCGDITVYGGVISATSSDGAGIGGSAGSSAKTGAVSINGRVNIVATGGNGCKGIGGDDVSLAVGDDVYVYEIYDRKNPNKNKVIDKIDDAYARTDTMYINNDAPVKVAELTSKTYYNESPFYNKDNAFRQWMAKGGTLKLCQDIKLDDNVDKIVLKNHDDYVLDLNGWGLIYDKKDQELAPVITVGSGATLALKDSNDAKKKSVSAYDPIYGDSVSKPVTGGYINGGKAGAVNVGEGGRFVMSCGTIIGNVGTYGGGITLASQNAVFTMNGGTIIGNKASVGSGVYMSDGTFNLFGSPVIKDNFASNVYLAAQNKINVSDALVEGACVGVTMQEGADTVFTTNYGVDNADVPPATYFTSDATGKQVLKAYDKDPVQAKLGKHQHDYSCQVNEEGTAIIITCADRDCGHEGTTQYSLGFTIPSPYVYGDDVKPEDLLDAVALEAFNEAYKDSGKTVTAANNIVYYKQGSSEPLDSMPVEAGDYRAELQIDAMDNSGVITIPQDYTIAKRDVTITGIAIHNKTYDGTTDAVIGGTAAIDSVAYGDEISINADNAKASFNDANAAADKPVTITGYGLAGDKSVNYNLNQPTGLKATITKRELLLKWDDTPLVYNGKAQTPEVTARTAEEGNAEEAEKGLVGDDKCDLSVEGAHKNAGENYTATAGSPSNPNYVLPSNKTQTFNIAQKPVEIEWDDTPLTYNGKEQAPKATVVAQYLEAGDTCEVLVSGGKTAAGDDYTATADGLTNANYVIPASSSNRTQVFSIAPKTVGLKWGDTSFIYDGQSHVPEVTATDLIDGDDCPLTATADGEAIEMGRYTATAKVPENTNYKLPDEKTKDFAIGKKIVDLTWDDTPLTYNGEAQTPKVTVTGTIDEESCIPEIRIEGEAAVNGEAINVGSYTAKVVALSGNYLLPNDESQTTHAFTIVKKPVKLIWTNTSLTYNGKDQKPTAEVSSQDLVGEDKCDVTVSGEQTNASDTEYTATAEKLSNDNYQLPTDGTEKQKFRINRKTAELDWTNTSMTYSGQELKPTATVTNLETGDICSVTVTGGQTNADVYTATASELSNNNYALPAEATHEFTINKKTVGLNWGSGVFVYDGEAHILTATATGVIQGDTCTVTVTGSTKDAGKHTATAEALSNANYALPAENTKDFNIAQKTVGLKWGEETAFTYDGQPHAPTVEATDLVPGDTCTVTVTGEQKNAASTEYTAKAEELSNDNYKLPTDGTEKQKFTIDKKTAELDWTNTDLIYNGKNQQPTATVSNLVEGDSCTVTVTGGEKTVGSYTAEATKLSNGNYALPDTVTQEFTIAQKTVGLSWSKTDLTYNGQEQQPTVKAVNLASGDTCTVTISGAQKNVGTYKATASGLSNANYKLPDDVTQDFTIGPKTVKLVWTDTSFTYDGQKHVPTATVNEADLVQGDTCAVTVTGEKRDVGNYTATASALSNENYALPTATTKDFSIARRTVGLQWGTSAFTYDGKAHVPAATATDLVEGDTCVVTVTGEKTNAGDNYTATASALSNPNYALPTAKTQKFTIGKKTVGLTWSDTSLTYNGKTQTPTVTATGIVTGDACTVTVTGGQKDVGSYTATASKLSNANYALPNGVTQSFTISPLTVGLTWSDTSLIYNGKEQVPTAKATGLVSGDTCTVTVTGAQKDVGSYTATATGLSNGNYALPKEVTQGFSITGKAVELKWENTSFTYDGESHVPTATATGLITGDECTVTVTGAAVNAGTYTATATVVSNGDYMLLEKITQTFTIAQRAVTVTASDQTIQQGGSILDNAATLSDVVSGHTLKSVKLAADEAKGSITPSEAVIVDANGNDVTANYKISYATGKLTVTEGASEPTEDPIDEPITVKIDVKDCKITVKDQAYTGKKRTPAVTVKFEKTKLKQDRDYTVAYKNNVAIGTATVTVKGKGAYTGSKKVTFKILPKKTAFSKLTGGQRKITLNWKNPNNITGYQIQYSLKKSFSGKKTVKIKKATTLTTTISGLEAGKTYYVRIRTYKIVKKKAYYSAWSAAKAVKTQ